MSRPLRPVFPGAVYHLTARGNAREPIYLDDDDRLMFLALLGRVSCRYELVVHGYCLMGNHYHLLAETPQANISAALRQLNGVYCQSFNRRWRRVGHLLQGRFNAVLVESDAHLLAATRYIVRNPVRAGLCAHADYWRWSSHRATAGLEPAPPFLRLATILGLFGEPCEQAARRYRAFVDEPHEDPPIHERLRGSIYLGSEEFARKASRTTPCSPENPRAHREPVRPSLGELLRHGDDAEIADAHRNHGYRLHEIAAHLGVHPSTVSRYLHDYEHGQPQRQRRRRRTPPGQTPMRLRKT